MAIPAALKKYLPFVKRAEELERAVDRDSKVVAYHCRLYVVVKGSKEDGASDPTSQAFLLSQMDILEKIKPTLGLSNSQSSFESCKNYAMKVFTQADEEDRMGVADKATVKLFYYAGSFFDVLDQFQDVDLAEVNEKKLYAKYRASEILNAIKNGVKPSPPSGEIQQATTSGALHDEPDETIVQQITAPYSSNALPSNLSVQEASATVRAAIPTAPIAPIFHNYGDLGVNKGPPTSSLDPRAKDCIELCHFAVRALQYNDMNLARERLKEALRRLE